ncbi:glucosaminidase domain-containing protein [Mucilaginibacter sp.]
MNQRIVHCLLIVVLLCSACAAKRKAVIGSNSNPGISSREAHNNNEQLERERNAAIQNFVPYTAAAYIQRFKAIAVQEMNLYGIPASITLAQGMFESGFGNGSLAKVANNHFGIKCTSDWQGRSYYKNDDRENDCFRVYDNPEDSFRDHSNFLKRKRYAALFELDKNDYESWAYGLKAAGYATNPKYPELLISTIQKYHLEQYDRPEGEVQKIKREDRVLTEINSTINKPAQDTLSKSTPDQRLYAVRQGDTLYSISRRFGITVDELKTLNHLIADTVKIGQLLTVVK